MFLTDLVYPGLFYKHLHFTKQFMNLIEFITTCQFRSLTVKAPLIQTFYQLAPPLSKHKNLKKYWTNDLMINIAKSQIAFLNTSHRLTRCQVFLNIRQKLSFNLNLSFWGLSQFELLSFITIWVVEFCHSLSFWNLSNFELNFVQIQVFECCYNSSFLVLL